MNKSAKRTIEKTASYGRIKITAMGGFVMSREYRHPKDCGKELIEYMQQGHLHKYPNLPNREFNAGRPDQKRVTDTRI